VFIPLILAAMEKKMIMEQIKYLQKDQKVLVIGSEKLFFSVAHWVQIVKGGIVGSIADDFTAETMSLNQRLYGGMIKWCTNEKSKDDNYVVKDFSGIYKFGAPEDMTVERTVNGKVKTVKLKAGQKAQIGDIAPVLKDGETIDYDSPILIKISTRAMLEYEAWKEAVKTATVDFDSVEF
jgi:hypothetical protein